MKILIISPSIKPDLTGNAVTADRLCSGLRDKGFQVVVEKNDSSGLEEAIRALNPDLILALHARKSGLIALKLSERHNNIPYIVTITGTDLNIDIDKLHRVEVINVLEKAAAVIVPSSFARERLIHALPAIKEKVTHIKPSIRLEDQIIEDRREIGDNSNINFLLPAGIRKVKDPSFAIEPLDRLRKIFPQITLTVAGPILEAKEWELFQEKSGSMDWITHEEVAHESMRSLYLKAHVVLNTSVSEGLANSILEAMYFGKPVLASDCEGNRAVISNAIDGLLYKQGDMDDFLCQAERLLQDKDLGPSLGKMAGKKVKEEFSLDREIEKYAITLKAAVRF